MIVTNIDVPHLNARTPYSVLSELIEKYDPTVLFNVYHITKWAKHNYGVKGGPPVKYEDCWRGHSLKTALDNCKGDTIKELNLYLRLYDHRDLLIKIE